MANNQNKLDSILLVGLNHHTTPVEVREKFAIHPELLQEALKDLQRTCSDHNAEFVLLSTCNRTEIYTYSSDLLQIRSRIFYYLADYAHLPLETLERSCSVHQGRLAAQHLLQVAAGLDSLVIGENEILGQVRSGFEAALSAGTAGTHLSALFRAALQTGKRVRNETEISCDRLSVASVVVELAHEILGSLNGRTTLLVGAGKISSLAARAMRESGLHCILIANRTYERAQMLAASLSGEAVHFDKLPESLIRADVVITSTGAPHIVLHAAAVERAMSARPERPLLVADLAVPRNADPCIAEIPGVRLVDIDDLEDLVLKRHPLPIAVSRRVEAIISKELECFQGWIEARRHSDLICALNRHADAIVQAQLKKTLRKLSDLTPEQQESIEIMGSAIASSNSPSSDPRAERNAGF